MLILALECSGEISSIALVQDKRLLAEVSYKRIKNQLIWLVPKIKEILKENKVNFSDIDRIALSSGPGSYTGLRIGMITAKTLAQSLNIPLIDFNTLEILAYNALSASSLICPVIDARKDEIFNMMFYSQDNQLIKVNDFLILKPDKLVDFLNQFKEKIIFLGNALFKYSDILKEKLKINYQILPESFWYPRAGNLAVLALKSNFLKYYYQLKINYGRPPDIGIPKRKN